MSSEEMDRAASAIAAVLTRRREYARRGIAQLDQLGFAIDASTRRKVEAMNG